MAAVTLFGYGSLLNAASTAMTCPTARNRRVGCLTGFVRRFDLVSISVLKANPSALESCEIAALSISPKEEGIVVGVLFEIDAAELPAYIAREGRYVVREVEVHDADGRTVNAWTAIASTDALHLAQRYDGDLDKYHADVGVHYSGSLWHRTDILPSQPYVHVCVNGALSLGCDVLVNLLGSLLADGVTTLHDHLLMSSPLKRLVVTPTGVPYNPRGPVIGPAVDVLDKALLVVIGPPDEHDAVVAAYDAFKGQLEECEVPPTRPSVNTRVLYLDWDPTYPLHTERLVGAVQFVIRSLACVGAIVLSHALQRSVYDAVELVTAGGGGEVVPVDPDCCAGLCECREVVTRRPTLACCGTERPCCPPAAVQCCASPMLKPDTRGRKAVHAILKHAGERVVCCGVPATGAASDSALTSPYLQSFQLVHHATLPVSSRE